MIFLRFCLVLRFTKCATFQCKYKKIFLEFWIHWIHESCSPKLNTKFVGFLSFLLAQRCKSISKDLTRSYVDLQPNIGNLLFKISSNLIDKIHRRARVGFQASDGREEKARRKERKAFNHSFLLLARFTAKCEKFKKMFLLCRNTWSQWRWN